MLTAITAAVFTGCKKDDEDQATVTPPPVSTSYWCGKY